MDPSVATAAAASTRPYQTRPELMALGYDDRDIRDALRSGTWRQVRVGTYAPAEVLDALQPSARNLLAARACVEKMGAERVALSHQTALAAYGVVADRASLDDVHLLRLDGGKGRTSSGVAHHALAPGGRPPLRVVDGLPVVAPAYAIRQVATRFDQKRTLGLLDAAYHAGIVDDAAMDAVAAVAERWPGAARFRLVLPYANALVESYGESYVR